MILLKKKRIIVISIAVLFSINVAVFNSINSSSGANTLNSTNNSNGSFGSIFGNSSATTPTVALPVSNKVIIVDAGHGSPDEGAEGSSGSTEAQTNLKIALKLQGLLEQSGSTVILTRSDENSIYDLDSKTLRQKKVSDVHNRVSIGNSSSADIFVSIHLNKIPEEQYWGWQCFYKKNDDNSNLLAKCIQCSLNDAIEKNNTRVPKVLENVYIMKHVEIPISIVECGFLSNVEEEKKLLDDGYQNSLAWGIYTGLMEYFSANN